MAPYLFRQIPARHLPRIIPFLYDVSVLAVGPHMHLIGKSIRSFGVTLSQDTLPFIDIPDWDFHWQGTYSFPRILHLPAGTTLYSSALYDNTSSNPNNPNNPPLNVGLGEATTDEMMLVYFAYTGYQPGDENIIQDSSILLSTKNISYTDIVSTPQLYSPFPNPANESTKVQFFLPEKTTIKFSISDLNGKILWSDSGSDEKSAGYHVLSIPLSSISNGMYILSMETPGIIRTKKLIID